MKELETIKRFRRMGLTAESVDEFALLLTKNDKRNYNGFVNMSQMLLLHVASKCQLLSSVLNIGLNISAGIAWTWLISEMTTITSHSVNGPTIGETTFQPDTDAEDNTLTVKDETLYIQERTSYVLHSHAFPSNTDKIRRYFQYLEAVMPPPSTVFTLTQLLFYVDFWKSSVMSSYLPVIRYFSFDNV
ncbi:hypothetical protein Ocin01_17907 [Orchesella cincta]|uniref:Uncharacterized protein n=1 Tax=Orchesella cincta TaxID=48709 RepID=A0A1D2M729_ORCCI|nr:hypothetical protein Ocin01_17907 [Orchesella cincta]